jgi:hypothetical protein
MKTSKFLLLVRTAVPAGLLAVTSWGHASTVWNGPSIAFYHTQENNLQDQLAADVKLTRGSSGGLYNSAMESGAVSDTSPKGTAWAVGTLANFSTLSYGPCPLEAGNRPPNLVNTTFVVHLTSASDDIYLQLTLTNWGGAGGSGDKTFGYIRTTASAPPPTISITNPVSGAVFGAPATVSIGASASVSSGTVTNVQFFTNGVSLKSVTTAPFIVTAGNLAAGAYALKAVATAAGISATSSVVNITVLSPPTVSITNPVSGAVFAAPANVSIGATATAASGTVTNVQFFTNGVSLASLTAAPFTLTANNLAAGAYTLTAVAKASGILATSTPVNVTVVNPAPVVISAASVSGGLFSFSYAGNAGLSYVVQSSSNLVNWLPVTTNLAAANPVPFSNPATNGVQFFRIGLLPNP